MRQWSKAARWSAACAGVVVCLLLSALGAVHFYFTPARVTALLQTRLQALSKRDVGLASARIAWLPSPGLAMQDMTLGNPAWAREKNLLHVSSLKLQLALLPLLSGRVAINAVALDGVTVNLERNQAGQTSWQDLMAQPTGQQKTPGEGSETQGSARKSSFEPLTLTDLTLSNARLSYRNTGSIGSTGSTGTRGAAIDGSAGHAERNNAVDSVDAWQIETLRARSQTGGRALDTSATVLHNGHRLDAHVQLADFSAIGEPGASTTGTVRLAWEKGTLTLDGVLPLAVPAALQGAATQAGSAVSSTPTASRPAASAPAALPAAPGKAAGTDPAAAAPMAADGTGIALPTRENRHSSSAAAPSFKLALDAASMRPLLGFVDIDTTPVAPVKLAAQLSMQGDWLHAANIQASLGQQTLSGDLLYSRSGTRPQFKASIHGQRIVWAQLTADAGRAAPPPVPPGEVFYVHDLAWNALVAMKPMDGTLALHLDAFRTRSNIDVSDVNASMRFAGDQLDIGSFTLKAFGGTAAGRMQLDGTRQTARLGIKTDAISLGQWVTQKTGKNLFTGAPLALTAQITASGSSMKKLAASLTGPVTVRIGPARILSEKAGNAETLLTGVLTLFADKSSNHLDLVCVNGQLPFKNGVAAASPLAGARSTASKLLTQGNIDLRKQTLALRGRLRPYTGLHLGIASLTGDVRIDGPLRHPGMHLDPLGSKGALARLGAAVLTGGLSLVATAAWDATVKGDDPCASALRTAR